MTKQIRWLNKQIADWQSEQLITDHQAQLLRARYPEPEQKRSWDRLIFPSIGAVVFGLGVILFFAYNWADMHKFIKLAVVFGSLLLIHSLGYYLTSPQRQQTGLGDGLHLLGTMLFGAGIWLIAQIYHLDEHYPNAFLVWGLSAMVFAWALPSVAQGLLAVVLLTGWSAIEIAGFDQIHHAGWLVILLGIMPLAWLLKSQALLLFSVLAFSGLLIYNVSMPFYIWMTYLGFNISCIYIALGKLLKTTHFPESGSVFRIVGFVAYMLFLFAFSFKLSHRALHFNQIDFLNVLYWLGPCFLAFACWSFAVWKYWGLMKRLERWESVLILIVMCMSTVHFLAPDQFHHHLLNAILFNGAFIAHCVILIIQGVQRLSWMRVSLGCVMMAALLLVRFTDLFGSLLVRSALFLLLGIGLFAVGYFYSKRKQREITHA